jgi:hypothetical protein
MKTYILDLLFLLSLIILYVLPRKSEKYKLFWIIPLVIFLFNLGIRAYLIYQNHKKSERIAELAKRVNVLNSLEIYVNLDEITENRELTQKETSVGIQSVVGLFTTDNTRFRFVTDFQFSYQQISQNIRRVMFIYRPEEPTKILGRNIEFLEKMDNFAFNYTGFINPIGFNRNNTNHMISITILLNGINVVSLENIGITEGKLYSGQLVHNVSEAFKNISEKYQKKIESKR